MAHAHTRPDDEILDVVGVGFGPSNLGLAIALEERNATVGPAGRLTARFVERQESFGWHRGMLLEDATMQVSYLKDLVTLRNPRSAFSFLSYLHDRGRLVDFINYGSAFPTRLEFHDYLEGRPAGSTIGSTTAPRSSRSCRCAGTRTAWSTSRWSTAAAAGRSGCALATSCWPPG